MRMMLRKTDTLKLLAFGLGITSVACGHQARAFQKRNHRGGVGVGGWGEDTMGKGQPLMRGERSSCLSTFTGSLDLRESRL